MISKHSSIIVIQALLLIFLFGCGGGGGGDTLSVDNENTDQSDNSVINNNISGRLFMGGDNDGKVLDLTTGVYTTIPGVDWTETQDNEYHPRAQYTALPSSDGSEFIVTVRNCLDTTNTEYPSLYDDCIVIHDSAGDIIGSGKMIEDITPDTRLSRDKQFIAFFHDDARYQSGRSDELMIFDRNFQFVSSTMLPGPTGALARSLDWLNHSGQLVYIHDQSIYITAPYDTDGTVLHTFSETEGRPDHIAASPDGSKIAFTLVDRATYRSIHGATWIMNSDGTDLHQLAYIPGNDNPIINYPAWSPDGEYIMNMVGDVAAGDNIDTGDLGVMGGLYAIPSDSYNVAINDNGESGIVHIQSYYQSNELNSNFSSNGNLVWIP